MATANLLQTSVSGGTQNALSLQGDGVFFPKASTTSRLALTLTTTDKGFIVYDTTDNNIYFWNGTAWESVPSSGDAGANGSVQYNDNGIVSGASNFTYDKATSAVAIGGAATVGTTLGVTGNSTLSGNTLNVGGSNSSPVVNFKAADTGSVTLNFGGTTNPDKGRILYSDNSDIFAFYTADTESMRLNSTGNVVLKGGTAAADGVGVTFPSVQVASSDANCLDDYEEGTWAPAVSISTANITAVASVNARYTKVGRIVTLSGQVSGTVTAPNLETYWILLGLPFTQGSTTVGTLFENAGLRIGSTQVVSNNLYSYFPAASAITAGAKDFYYEITYTV